MWSDPSVRPCAGFPWQASREKLPSPHGTRCTARFLHSGFLQGLQGLRKSHLASHARMHPVFPARRFHLEALCCDIFLSSDSDFSFLAFPLSLPLVLKSTEWQSLFPEFLSSRKISPTYISCSIRGKWNKGNKTSFLAS